MAIPVNIFNADDSQINVNVNNAPNTFQVPGADASNWFPGVPKTNPRFTPGPPTPGVLGIGTNKIQLTPEKATQTYTAQVVLPDAVNWASIQIYVFFLTNTSCSCFVLNAGQLVSQSTTYATALVHPQ